MASFSDQTTQDRKAGEADDQTATKAGDKQPIVVGDRTYNSLDELIQSHAHAQKHISTLEQEAAARREQQQGSDNASNQELARLILDGMKSKDRKDESTSSSSKVELSKEDVVADVISKLAEQQTLAQKTANSDKCHEKAKEVYGEEYLDKVSSIAKELNMTIEEVDRLSETSVDAWSRLFLPSAPKGSQTSFASKSDVTTRALDHTMKGSDDDSEHLSLKGKSDKQRVAMISNAAAKFGIEYGKKAR